jgi:general secretion pathway protein M
VPTLNREQTISIAVLALVVVTALMGLSLCLQVRADAVEELAERSDALTRLEASLRTRQDMRGRPSAAPAAAFAQAASEGLASAEIQAYVARVAAEQQAVLISSGVESAKGSEASDMIQLQVTFDAGTNALQAILHRLESGTPYVFVRSLTVQPVGAAAQRSAEDPMLRATLSLHAMWRRAAPDNASGGKP